MIDNTLTKTDNNKVKHFDTHRFDEWVRYYTDKNNPKTYGNGTQSVFAAYGTHITYSCAGHMATENKKKFKYMRSMIADKEGITFDKFVKVAWAHYLKTGREGWYDRVKEVTGFDELLPQTEER